MEGYVLGVFPKDGKILKLISSLKLLFGARYLDGYHKMSLKAALNDFLGVDRAAIFKTDRGARFGIVAHNIRALILNKEAVMEALGTARKNEPKAASLLEIMSKSWREVAIKLALFALFWYLVVSPFHAEVSKTFAPWSQIKAAIEETREKLRKIMLNLCLFDVN